MSMSSSEPSIIWFAAVVSLFLDEIFSKSSRQKKGEPMRNAALGE